MPNPFEGLRPALEVMATEGGRLFATDDLRRAVESFLADGPGHATFEGR